jgi:hypothetical protein
MRFWVRVWRDIQQASEHITEIDAVIKAVVAIVVFLAVGLGLSTIFDRRWYAVLTGLFVLVLSFYFGSWIQSLPSRRSVKCKAGLNCSCDDPISLVNARFLSNNWTLT